MRKKLLSNLLKQYNSLPIVIEPLFLAFGLYCVIIGLWQIFLCYTLSAVLHELGHFIVAKRCGYKMVQLKLMPYGAVLCGELDQFLYNDEIKIALAGPITSLMIASVIVSLWWIFPNSYLYTYDFCISNLVCAVFNILPIFPLDGGRVVVAHLSKSIRRIDALKYAKIATKVFSLILFSLFVLSCFYTINMSFGIVSLMLFVSSSSSSVNSNYFRITSRKERLRNSARGVEVVELIVDRNAFLYKIYAKLKSQKFYRFIIVDESLRFLQTLDETIFDEISPDDFRKTFGEILLLKYNKNISRYR